MGYTYFEPMKGCNLHMLWLISRFNPVINQYGDSLLVAITCEDRSLPLYVRFGQGLLGYPLRPCGDHLSRDVWEWLDKKGYGIDDVEVNFTGSGISLAIPVATGRPFELVGGPPSAFWLLHETDKRELEANFGRNPGRRS